jgi:hypothetical protein
MVAGRDCSAPGINTALKCGDAKGGFHSGSDSVTPTAHHVLDIDELVLPWPANSSQL